MKKIPLFYLRKPWYTLLKLTRSDIGKQVWRDALSEIKHLFRHNIEIIELHSFDDRLLSTEERELNNLGITYSAVYKIRNGAKKVLCIELQKQWQELAEKDPLYKDKLFKLHSKAFRGKVAQSRTSLQNDINNPLTNFDVPLTNDVNIRIEMAIYICELAKFACREDTEEVQQIDIVLNQIEAIKELPSGNYLDVEVIQNELFTDNLNEEIIQEEHSSNSYNDSIGIIDNFWRQANQNPLPERFYNSHWICYERTDANSKPKASWGIALSHIYIGVQIDNGYTPITFQSQYNNKSYKSVGLVSYDIDSKYLVAHLIRQVDAKDDTPETSSIFIMRVRDAENQTLLTGHYCNYSIYFERLITKMVVWTSTNAAFSPQDLVNVDKQFSRIDLNIRQFLNSRQQNRLTSPHNGLSNLKNKNDKDRSLHSWLANRITKVQGDKKLRSCVDKYYVCYFFGDVDKAINVDNRNQPEPLNSDESDNSYKYLARRIRIDEMEILFDHDAVAFNASYLHHTTEPEGKSKRTFKSNSYEGRIVRMHSTIQVFVEQKIYKSRISRTTTTEGNFILLNFHVPQCHADESLVKFNKADYFEGVLSGLSDSRDEPLSFRAVIVKRRTTANNKSGSVILNFNDNQNRNELSKKIIQYFQRHINEHQIKITR